MERPRFGWNDESAMSMNTDLASLLELRTEEQPDKTLFEFPREDRLFTYSEFDARVNRCATGLMALGIERGSFVAVMLRSGSAFLTVSYAIKKLGAVEVAINPEFRASGLARMINLTEAQLLVCSHEMLAALEPIADELRALTTVVSVDTSLDDVASVLPGPTAVDFDSLFEFSDRRPDRPHIPETDLQAIIFTSGTTGMSKGCMVSHRYAIRIAESLIGPLRFTREDRLFTFYPLSHVGAAYFDVLPGLMVGGTVIVVPRFSLSRFWTEVRDNGVTRFHIQGTIGKLLLLPEPSAIEREHDVRLCWGGPFPFDVEAFEERFNLTLLRGGGYSSTDAGSVAMGTWDKNQPLTCSGQVFPHYDVEIQDHDGYQVPVGEPGEICIRPNEPDIMAKGYFGMPDATLESRRNLWFHSGDVGYFDALGRLHFMGRKVERIRRKGENVSAFEVEEALELHAAVEEAAVVPVPAELGEDDVHAFVKVFDGQTLTTEDLLAFCEERMARYMIPTHVTFVDEIPKTGNGKVALKQLLELSSS